MIIIVNIVGFFVTLAALVYFSSQGYKRGYKKAKSEADLAIAHGEERYDTLVRAALVTLFASLASPEGSKPEVSKDDV